MQFIPGGPDIPETLLEAHEEGRVVFFCGAGISYPAGLPGFEGLVNLIYETVGVEPDSAETLAIELGRFDSALDLLERRVIGQRLAVREALAEALKPKLKKRGSSDTHAALLQLATARDGAVRLVTTNFDRLFQRLMDRAKPRITPYAAPSLPIPKKSKWNGVVYLHGLLPEELDPAALNRLVVTSGDFGLAYLTERWAARFVSEMFRNYVVCFVGYTINDPVLRYMMDALAADRMLGEATPQAYAMGESKPGEEVKTTAEWEAKGVKPILYTREACDIDHAGLHQTLRAWASVYRDGIQGKEAIVVKYAIARPNGSTKEDDFVGRMIWALSDKSGLPARRFAEHKPAPALDWLVAFSEERFRHHDLTRFGVSANTEVDPDLNFGLTHRPAPYYRASRMSLVSSNTDCDWDEVMWGIGRWLVRHLDNLDLALWVARRGGRLHKQFEFLVDRRLTEIEKLEREVRDNGLQLITSATDDALPSEAMRLVWRLVLGGHLKTRRQDRNIFRWQSHFSRDGNSTLLRMELRELLAPQIVLNKPLEFRRLTRSSAKGVGLRKLVDWDLVLGSDHVYSLLGEIRKLPRWEAALPSLFEDLEALLRDALNLFRELGDANNKHDRSYWDQPSISDHWQNRGFRDWVVLIELVRDSWIAIHRRAKSRAQTIASNWIRQPYPAFKRLALFAAAHGKGTPGAEWVNWLLSDNAHWLWSVETQREAMRLLVKRGATLGTDDRNRLERQILKGPLNWKPRKDIEQAVWATVLDHSVWLRLSKLRLGGASLGVPARGVLNRLGKKHPKWRLAHDESDEFSHWMSGTGDPGFDSHRKIKKLPRTREGLADWLRLSLPNERPNEDDWQEICRDRFFQAAFALSDRANEGEWPAVQWREALQIWSDSRLARLSWRILAPTVDRMPVQELRMVGRAVSSWLQAAARSLSRHRHAFLSLCDRLLRMTHQDGMKTERPVTRALNHPIGHVTQALLHFWFRRELNDKEGLTSDIEPLLTFISEAPEEQYRNGRVLLFANLIALYRVDPLWARVHLLPHLDWDRSTPEAQAAWEAFLWSPRIYQPLMNEFRESFLATSKHYEELGEHKRQYAAFLTYAALDPSTQWSRSELRKALADLPSDGLQEAAQALANALDGAGDQREQYWANRVLPFWKDVWPHVRDRSTDSISQQLARLAIAAGERFPEALDTVFMWLRPVEYPLYVIGLLSGKDLCTRFPREALKLLDAITGSKTWSTEELDKCLSWIRASWPESAKDRRYTRLSDLVRGSR